MHIIRVPGDGSCLIHSILGQICSHYNSLSKQDRSTYVSLLRKQISERIDEKTYNTLGNGSLKCIMTFKDWKDLIKSNNPLGEECFEFLCHFFMINMTIYWKDMKKYPMNYSFGSHYKDVFIYWDGNHYDIVVE